MKFLNKFSSLVLVLLLGLTALLAACGDNTATTAPAATTAVATTAAPTTAAPTTAAATTAAPTTVATTTAAPTTAATTAATTTAATTTAAPTTAATTAATGVKQFNNGQPYTLTVWTIGLKASKDFNPFIQGIFDNYKKTHPNVTIVWEDYGAEIDQKLLAAVASGNVPDVVNFNTSYSLRMAANGALADINKIITPEQKAVYFPSIFDATKVGEATYSVPWYASLQVAFINKALWTKAGLDPAKPPTTYQDLADAAKAFHDKTEAYAFQPITNLAGEALIEGFPMLSPDGKKAAFNTPDAVAKLTFYETLRKGDLIPSTSPYSDTAYDDALKNYKAGKLGILLSGASLAKQVQADAPDVYKNTVVAPAPVGKSGLIPVDLQGLTIPAGSKNKEAALDLALVMTNDENQLAFCHLATILPTTQKAAQDPFFQGSGDLLQEARKVSANSLKRAKDPTVNLPNADKLQKAINDNLNEWWAGIGKGGKSAQQALDDTAKAWNDILAK